MRGEVREGATLADRGVKRAPERRNAGVARMSSGPDFAPEVGNARSIG